MAASTTPETCKMLITLQVCKTKLAGHSTSNITTSAESSSISFQCNNIGKSRSIPSKDIRYDSFDHVQVESVKSFRAIKDQLTHANKLFGDNFSLIFWKSIIKLSLALHPPVIYLRFLDRSSCTVNLGHLEGHFHDRLVICIASG